MPSTKLTKLTRVFGPTSRLDRPHFHGGVVGRVELCDDPRCDGAGRGSTGRRT